MKVWTGKNNFMNIASSIQADSNMHMDSPFQQDLWLIDHHVPLVGSWAHVERNDLRRQQRKNQLRKPRGVSTDARFSANLAQGRGTNAGECPHKFQKSPAVYFIL